MRPHYAFLLLILLLRCAPIAFINLNDQARFKESPKIIKAEDRFFIRFRYADDESEGPPPLFMSVQSKIIDDKLVFFVPATASAGNMSGQLQFEEITPEKKVEIIKSGQVFWKEVNGDLLPVTVEPATEEDIGIINSKAENVY
jgi:hypothetical protein